MRITKYFVLPILIFGSSCGTATRSSVQGEDDFPEDELCRLSAQQTPTQQQQQRLHYLSAALIVRQHVKSENITILRCHDQRSAPIALVACRCTYWDVETMFIHILNQNGEYRGMTVARCLPGGHWMKPEVVRSDLRCDVLRFDITKTELRQRQFYCVLENRLALLRLEDAEGRVQRICFASPSVNEGPPTLERTSQEWMDAIFSSNRTTQLEALAWLGGTHLAPETPTVPEQWEKIEDAKANERIRNSPNVHNLLSALRENGNSWVRDAAMLAMTPDYFPSEKVIQRLQRPR